MPQLVKSENMEREESKNIIRSLNSFKGRTTSFNKDEFQKLLPLIISFLPILINAFVDMRVSYSFARGNKLRDDLTTPFDNELYKDYLYYLFKPYMNEDRFKIYCDTPWDKLSDPQIIYNIYKRSVKPEGPFLFKHESDLRITDYNTSGELFRIYLKALISHFLYFILFLLLEFLLGVYLLALLQVSFLLIDHLRNQNQFSTLL